MLVDVEATVLRNTRLSPDYNVITLAAPDIATAVRPGQFVMVKSHRGHDPLLRRPFSVFEVIRAGDRVEGLSLLSKRVGVVTRLLYEAVEGDVVSCLGPLGQPFRPVDPPERACMVAGGVGLAPFATLTEALRERGTPTTLVYGARSRDELFYLDWFAARGVDLITATEDGSAGARGRVTVPLDRHLHETTGPVTLYACGPEPMLEAVSRVAAAHDTPAQVSVERVMGCGMGGCYSCVMPVRSEGRTHYVRSCLAGPVFPAADVVWHE